MAGILTPSALLKIQLKAESMWSDAATFNRITPQAEAARVLLTHQTAKFDEISLPGKDNSVLVSFIKSCRTAVDDCDSTCDLDEPELDTDAVEYSYDTCFKTGFSVDEEKFRTNTYNKEEFIARGLAEAVKRMDEKWAQNVLVKMKAYAGINVAPSPFTYDAAHNTTDVPAAYYGTFGTDSGFYLPSAFLKQSILNRMDNVFFLDNGRLFIDYNNAKLRAGGQNGSDIAGVKRADSIDLNFDMFNFAAAGITNATTFMINRNAIAFRTRNRFTPTPTLIAGNVQQTVYTMPSIALPGVRYDVYYGLVCKTVNGEAHYVHTWQIRTKGGIWQNPTACTVTVGGTDYNPTGIISYTAHDEIV